MAHSIQSTERSIQGMGRSNAFQRLPEGEGGMKSMTDEKEIEEIIKKITEVSGTPNDWLRETLIEGIRIGQEEAIQYDIDKIEEIKIQARKDAFRYVIYQLQTLNTTELHEKAPLCWLKLQQVIDKIEEIKAYEAWDKAKHSKDCPKRKGK